MFTDPLTTPTFPRTSSSRSSRETMVLTPLTVTTSPLVAGGADQPGEPALEPKPVLEDDARLGDMRRIEGRRPVDMGTRRAENALREDEGLPRVGEGWIAETKLYYDLKAACPDIDVRQHARTKWLGLQHLDIFMPTLNIAFEYQGPQRDGPVAFFGGEAAFKEVQRRDARKRRLCKTHGVELIEVRPAYDLQELLERIRLRRQAP